jgi:hypothetical protein
MPTWFFFGDAGLGTAGFAEPIIIDKQQNFRAEIAVPHPESLKELQRIYGPMLIWVVLDGDLTRDA